MLVLIGAAGFSLGSWLHDLLRIPVVGNAFDVFGHVNVLYLSVGIVLAVIGVILLALSLRGGILLQEGIEAVKQGKE